MIGDFPIQFSIYTNCPLHHVFLAWEACESWVVVGQTEVFSNKARQMSNFLCVFVYLLFVLKLSSPFVLSENHYCEDISCLCTSLNISLCVSSVFIIPAFVLLRFLKLLMQINLNTVHQFFAYFLPDFCKLFFVYQVFLQPKFKFISRALIRWLLRLSN